jgi:S-DNA-T family DNA segregation ATPase FtsK/SpoIIIE
VLIFCLTKLKDLLAPNEKERPQSEYMNKQDLYAWLDEYFKQKFVEKPTAKNISFDDDVPIENITSETEIEMPPQTSQYEIPPLDLLTCYPQENTENIEEEIENKKQLIKQTLSDFGISITDISATVGATVTLYELVPARGVAIIKITNKDAEIAIALKVDAVRIIAPFKNRGTVAIEVPNVNHSIVGIKSLLEGDDFQNCSCELPLAIGKTIDGQTKIIDLTEMPHILVGGATNNGKSVGLNAMLTSLLYTKRPEEMKLVLIDPKINEFSIYKKLGKRFNAPNIPKTVFNIEYDEIADTLQSLCNEMKKRQLLFERANCRNIQEYNADKKADSADYMPRIVVVIDEFVDLFQESSNKLIEATMLQLVRKSRAQGIHLIAATQRPSAKQCSTDITSQFTARIAFKVGKRQDSDIILGESGAEKLIGNGDMLFSNNSELERLQGAFVSTEEVKSIVEFIGKQR